LYTLYKEYTEANGLDLYPLKRVELYRGLIVYITVWENEMKRLFVALLAGIMVISITACGSTAASTQTEPTQDTTQETQANISSEDMDALIKKLDEVLDDAWGANREVSKSDDGQCAMVELWYDGMSQVVLDAVDGNSYALDTWNSTMDSIEEMSKAIYEIAEGYCGEDVKLVVALLDEYDHEKVFLAYTGDGELYTNIVEENQ